jgi:hypothetical protein
MEIQSWCELEHQEAGIWHDDLYGCYKLLKQQADQHKPTLTCHHADNVACSDSATCFMLIS